MAEPEPVKSEVTKQRIVRCLDWLQKQNSQPKRLSLQNKNDIQFIIQTNAERKNFLLAAAEDLATVPAGVDEPDIEPKVVPSKKLRVDKLHMDCQWPSCTSYFSDYTLLQTHVRNHLADLDVIDTNEGHMYVCLWDACGHKTLDYPEMVRHMNYHAYHSRLLAIGFNARATLKLARCTKDSSKRNQLPLLANDHKCMWFECEAKFNSIQTFFDHIRQHTTYSEDFTCSWGGCGMVFSRRQTLVMHVRSHTAEKLIACFHCGRHFSCNVKLNEHLVRQNVNPNSSYRCSVCGQYQASEALLRAHAAQHISGHACALCAMTAVSAGALAVHVRYRHMSPSVARVYSCNNCHYKAVTKKDLRKHMLTHNKKKKKPKTKQSDEETSDGENSELEILDQRKETVKKKYACHLCPENDMKVFSRGHRLTRHLVKVHEAEWPFGHSRFRYHLSEDGMYRLTTTRYEFLDVSNQIVNNGYSGLDDSKTNSLEFKVKRKEPTVNTPTQFEIMLKDQNEIPIVKKSEGFRKVERNEENNERITKIDRVNGKNECIPKIAPTNVEIEMCDVDEHGNIINMEVIKSDVLYE